MKVVFSPKYAVSIGAHVFPTVKFGLAVERLLEAGALKRSELVEPSLAPRADLLLAHTADWVDRVMKGGLTMAQEEKLELPWSKELAVAHAAAAAGTTLACRDALENGVGLHSGGGSHHAFAAHGEGFCVFNDIACAILKLKQEKRIHRAAVVDLDVHQGNGTSSIFKGDKSVFTFSMHQENIYPFPKVPSTLDIGLDPGTGDDEFLRELGAHLPKLLDRHKPDLVVYQAGVDCYEKDLLGGLKITKAGMKRRDELVFEECAKRRVPVAVTLGGGYAQKLADTVELHAQTLACGLKRAAQHA